MSISADDDTELDHGVDVHFPALRTGQAAVQVRAPARLSFTLINLDGKSLRRNGIAALAVHRPGLTATVRVTDGPRQVIGTDDETTREVAAAIGTLRQLWDGPEAVVEVTKALPQHSGFGSKTSTLLGIGTGYAQLCGRQPDLSSLATALGRGRTSGASTGLARHGGFLVDGGHRNPPEFYAQPGQFLRPSRFAQPVPPPAPVVTLPFPDWPILILLTHGRHLGGTEELSWFRSVTPIPAAEAARTAQLVFMGLAPAVAERDYVGFCAAVNEITFRSRFKQEQIKFQGSEMVEFLERGRRQPGIDAIALSVTGPACFAFSREPDRARQWAQGLRDDGAIKDFWFTNANNNGLDTAIVP